MSPPKIEQIYSIATKLIYHRLQEIQLPQIYSNDWNVWLRLIHRDNLVIKFEIGSREKLIILCSSGANFVTNSTRERCYLSSNNIFMWSLRVHLNSPFKHFVKCYGLSELQLETFQWRFIRPNVNNLWLVIFKCTNSTMWSRITCNRSYADLWRILHDLRPFI